MLPKSRSSQSRRSRAVNQPISIPLNLFFQKFLPLVGCNNGLPEGLDDDATADFICGNHFAGVDRKVEYLLSEVVSKFSTGKTSSASYAEAKRRFWLAEDRCKDTNLRFWSGRIRHSPCYPAILQARKQIYDLLGPEPCLGEVERYLGWGPGATTRLPRRRSDSAYKYSGKPESTAGNLVLASAAICSVPLWKREVFSEESNPEAAITVVQGNKVLTVPKNRKTDRVIAIEPDMNIYVQKGFGGVIRSALRRWGVDLNDQTPNQRLAREGSISGRFATIDLSMASDTISRAIVEFLLPPKWVAFLEQARSPFGFFEDQRIFYAKFSSMGNGFTFELESMIFCALCRACYRLLGIEGRPVVYGDDIIVDTRAFELVIHTLSECGFEANAKKSFGSGPFRESCGKHYLDGTDVSPFYIRRPIKGLEELILLHNNLWRWSRLVSVVDFEPLLQWLRAMAPKWMQNQTITDDLGDGAFVGDTVTCRRRRHPYQWDVAVINVWSPRSFEKETDVPGLLLKSLRRLDGADLERTPMSGDDGCPYVSVFPLAQGGYKRRKLLVHSPLA